ncbi:MAG: hypothetical protein JZU65_07180, partial [Chlorobium sp.]|nr:hypothetical protein [Chlorobium sp.]
PGISGSDLLIVCALSYFQESKALFFLRENYPARKRSVFVNIQHSCDPSSASALPKHLGRQRDSTRLSGFRGYTASKSIRNLPEEKRATVSFGAK